MGFSYLDVLSKLFSTLKLWDIFRSEKFSVFPWEYLMLVHIRDLLLSSTSWCCSFRVCFKVCVPVRLSIFLVKTGGYAQGQIIQYTVDNRQLFY
jgi:hypothetical protein